MIFDNKLLNFSSQDSRIYNNEISTYGKINFYPLKGIIYVVLFWIPLITANKV